MPTFFSGGMYLYKIVYDCQWWIMSGS